MVAMKAFLLSCVGCSLVGCTSVPFTPSADVVVRTSAGISSPALVKDKNGSFFLVRSMLCRRLFAEAVTNLAMRTGRDASSLHGATVGGIVEKQTNGVFSMRLDVVWSEVREAAADRVGSSQNSEDAVYYRPSADEERSLSTWIGPKQVVTPDGQIHFLGISARAVGHNAVLSQSNIRQAELDAQAMAVRPYLGRDGKMENVRASFRQVLRRRSRHPLCPDRDMFVCGYEVIALELSER